MSTNGVSVDDGPVDDDSVDDISLLQAVALGLLQGATEFAPVSSSAHLNLAHRLMGHRRPLAFDVVLSAGTSAALLVAERAEIGRLWRTPEGRRLRNLLAFATLPAVGTGLLVHRFQERPPLNQIWFNALMLLGGGGALWLASGHGSNKRSLAELTGQDALLLGSAQALALLPGVSRSGATLAAGLAIGLQQPEAVRVSLLMSLPVSVGATLHELPRLSRSTRGSAPLWWGCGAAFLGGISSIGFLLNYLKAHKTTPFVIWRLVLGTFILLSYCFSADGLRRSSRKVADAKTGLSQCQRGLGGSEV